MLTVFSFVLSFLACTLAYELTFPTADSGWTNEGPQIVSWRRVDTDFDKFAISLDNQHIQNFQKTQLAAEVPAGNSSGSTKVNAPSGGWPIGSGFRVKLEQVDNVNSQLVQSDEFEIRSSNSSTTSSGSGSTIAVVPTASTPTTGATGTSDSSASDSTDILPTSSSAAALSYPVQTGLLGLFSLLGFALV